MKNILVIGATGQIGSELTLELRKRYGDDHVIAGYIPSAMPKGELKASGPSAIADVTDRQSIEVVARQFKIDTIYNLAALLSVVAESRPAMAWKIGIDGLWNVLEQIWLFVSTVIVLDVQKPIRMVYWFTDREISFLERDLR